MKRDIRINVAFIEGVICNIDMYYESLSNMQITFLKIKEIVGNSQSQSLDELQNHYNNIDEDIIMCKKELDEIGTLFRNYLNEMQSYISPIIESLMMMVDRNDIWWNLKSMESAVMSFQEEISYSKGTLKPNVILDNECQKYNYELIQEIDGMVVKISQWLSNCIDELWQIYHDKVVPFENTDDQYKSKAKELYYHKTKCKDLFGDILTKIDDGFRNLLTGAYDSIVDLIKGISFFIAGTVIYIGSDLVLLISMPFTSPPKWAFDYALKTNYAILNVLEDPMIILEGLIQDISDKIDTKGICYTTGYVGGHILGSKGLDKFVSFSRELINGENSFMMNMVDDVKSTLSRSPQELYQMSTCSRKELFYYIEGNTSYDVARTFMLRKTWPEELPIPSCSSALSKDGLINWNKVPMGGYTLDINGSPIKEQFIPKIGDIIDRYGNAKGKYACPVIDEKSFSYSMRSLPYVEDLSNYHQYKVIGDFEKLIGNDSIVAYKGTVAPVKDWGEGGAIQYEFNVSLEELEKLGLIKEIKWSE